MCRGSKTDVEEPRQAGPCDDVEELRRERSRADEKGPKQPRPHAGKLELGLTRLRGKGAEPKRRRSGAKAARPVRAGLCKGRDGFRSVASGAGKLGPMRARPEGNEAGSDRAWLWGGSTGPGCKRSDASTGLPMRKEERMGTVGSEWTGSNTGREGSGRQELRSNGVDPGRRRSRAEGARPILTKLRVDDGKPGRRKSGTGAARLAQAGLCSGRGEPR